MHTSAELLIGEFSRTLDDRFRLSLPPELAEPLAASGGRMVLAKERAGCLSLWSAAVWKPRLDAAVDVVRSKMQAGLLAQRVGQVTMPVFASEDARVGATAFAQKRPPVWKGR